jgi:hypothetical protein
MLTPKDWRSTMSRPLESFSKERDILNRVLASKSGLVATFNSIREARSFRINCYLFRKLDKDHQAQGLDYSDPRRGRSPYDLIKFELHENPGSSPQIFMRLCENIMETQGISGLRDLTTGEIVDIEPAPIELTPEEEKLFQDALLSEKPLDALGTSVEDELDELTAESND